MSIYDVKALYTLSIFCLSLIIISPTIVLVVPLPEGERFSELWVLGAKHAADDFPSNVTVDTVYSVFVGVGNHMGSSEYYVVYVKIRNQTQPLPDIATSQASALAPVYEFRFLLENNDAWESHFTFAFHNVTVQDTTMHVRGFAVNQMLFSVDLQSAWDAESQGFYYQVFFELWRYNATSHDLQFHNRFVFVWLNVTFLS